MADPRPKRIVLVGAGNVAWHLAPALEQAGHQVEAVYSRKPENAGLLAARLRQARSLSSLDFSAIPADVYLLAVADQALPGLLKEARFPPGSLIAHTSGCHPLSVLDKAGANLNTGVLYPLQTFSKAKPVDFAAVPFCVEGSDVESRAVLLALAHSLSGQVHRLGSEERKRLHVAAVFACNFTNHLLGIGFELLQQAGLPGHLLHPLIRETVDKALAYPPFSVQTGPAVRGDQAVLEDHLRLLADQPAYQQLYRILSESIQDNPDK
jgi:predicted short-subunit dehydrogenase-like oxidoreductase (DUF2520 family)